MKYSTYKQGNTPWFREIPQHWEITKIGRIAAKIGSGKTPRGGAETYAESGVTFIRSQNVYNDGLRLDEIAFIDKAVDEEMSETRIYPRDVLLNITGASLGRCSLVADDVGPANVNQHVCIIRPDGSRVNPAFLWLAVVSSPTENQIFSYENGSSREGLNFQQVRDLLIPLPSISEQEDIVQFLGNRLNEIDTLVRKKEELIEKLQEKRSVLISRTVTRGLPPEAAKAAGLDPHPKMKHSSVEWLGRVPEHWEARRISKITSMITNGFVGPTRDILEPEGIRYLQSLHVKENSIRFDHPYYVSESWSRDHAKSILQLGDVLIVQTGDIGQVASVPEEFVGCNCHAMIIARPKSGTISGEFLALLLNSHYGYSALKRIQTGALHPHLNCGLIRDINVPFPPLPEQRLIVAYLAREAARIDSLIALIVAAIERLTEYRSTLISAAVTGKIDVRNHAGD